MLLLSVENKENEQAKKQYEKIPISDGLSSHPRESFYGCNGDVFVDDFRPSDSN